MPTGSLVSVHVVPSGRLATTTSAFARSMPRRSQSQVGISGGQATERTDARRILAIRVVPVAGGRLRATRRSGHLGRRSLGGGGRVGVAYVQRPGSNVVTCRWTPGRLRHPYAQGTGRAAAGTGVHAASCRRRCQRRDPGRRAVPAGVRVLPRRVGPRRHARSRSHDRHLEPRRLGRGAGRHDHRRRAWHRDARPRPPEGGGDRADRRLPAHAAAARHPVPRRRHTRRDAVLRRRALWRVSPRKGPRGQGRPGAHQGGFGAVARLSHRVHSRARALPDRKRGHR